jgi:hypothetical protein
LLKTLFFIEIMKKAEKLTKSSPKSLFLMVMVPSVPMSAMNSVWIMKSKKCQLEIQFILEIRYKGEKTKLIRVNANFITLID